MILSDVNVLVYAFRESAVDHRRFREWLVAVVEGPESFGVANIVLSGFLRVITHPRIFDPSGSLEEAMRFCEFVRDRPNATLISPGPHHWEIFAELCTRARARGDLVSDAYLAALAIESDCELITLDRDFARFPGLRWRHPF